MTKYVLNSGGLRNEPELARKFFAEILKELGNRPKILMCFFAQPRECWEQKFQEFSARDYFSDNVKPIFELAFPKNFENQVKNSDVVYIHGGDDTLLQFYFSKYDLPKIWENKVVGASSAGSDVLCKYFWTCDWRKNMDGLGLLPIKFLPHYQSDYGKDDSRGPIDWEKAKKELENYKDRTLPVYALKEGEYVVIEQ